MKEKILIVEDQFAEADYLDSMLTKAGYEVIGIARSVDQARQAIGNQRPDFVLLDIFLKGKETGIDLAKELACENIPFVYLSANSNESVLKMVKATQPYGFLEKPFRAKDLLVMLEIARYRQEHSSETYWRKATVLREKLKLIVSGSQSWEIKILELCKVLQPHIPYDYITVGFDFILEIPNRVVSFLRIGFDEYQRIGINELLTITGLQMRHFQKKVNDGTLSDLLSKTFELNSCTSLQIDFSEGRLFTLVFYSRSVGVYNDDTGLVVKHLISPISQFIENNFFKEKNESSAGPQQLTNFQNQDITSGFDGIVGNSHLMFNVFDMINQVAQSDTSILILGESGTGKELIADCIHNLSPRKNKPFVKINCAALPASLIESELFGHEKGSFTGALEKRIGKFEKAHTGTIFLDEIGEMPIDLQVKLLRVLQEKYIERIGASDPTPVDVRIIAATNRNLEREVAEQRFRLDLYYRLNVFPIQLPALRDRSEDITALAKHFMYQFSSKTGKNIGQFSDKVMREMTDYHWPGNIRELQNLIERAVLLTKGTIIERVDIPSGQSKDIRFEEQNARLKTIHENERDYIIAILKKCNGKIWGHGGAAALLNLPSSTLRSRMKKLGIRISDLIND